MKKEYRQHPSDLPIKEEKKKKESSPHRTGGGAGRSREGGERGEKAKNSGFPAFKEKKKSFVRGWAI